MANVLVSYRSADFEDARALAEAVRDAGHAVWLDEWEIALGDSIVERIEHGLEGASCVLVCYSGSGVMSPWMSREWMSSLARQLDGHRVRILPVRLSGGEPPALLADIKYADLAADWDNGLRQVPAAVR